MKSRVRCCSMRSTTATPSAAAFYRCYLKPGALAQLRNSKITAKFMAKDQQILLSQIEPTYESPVVNYEAMEVIPCFTSRFKVRRPRCLLRKKLIPVAPVFSES